MPMANYSLDRGYLVFTCVTFSLLERINLATTASRIGCKLPIRYNQAYQGLDVNSKRNFPGIAEVVFLGDRAGIDGG